MLKFFGRLFSRPPRQPSELEIEAEAAWSVRKFLYRQEIDDLCDRVLDWIPSEIYVRDCCYARVYIPDLPDRLILWAYRDYADQPWVLKGVIRNRYNTTTIATLADLGYLLS